MKHSPIKGCNHCYNVSERTLLKEVDKGLSSIRFDDELKSALADRLKHQYKIQNENTYYHLNIEFESLKSDLKFKISKMENPDTNVDKAIDNILNFSKNSFAIFKSSQIEEKRRILNIVFANFLMDGKNPEISMHKNFKLLSKIGACEDYLAS